MVKSRAEISDKGKVNNAADYEKAVAEQHAFQIATNGNCVDQQNRDNCHDSNGLHDSQMALQFNRYLSQPCQGTVSAVNKRLRSGEREDKKERVARHP